MPLSDKQRAKVREIAIKAHEARMRLEARLRVRDESVEFIGRLRHARDVELKGLQQMDWQYQQLQAQFQRGRISQAEFDQGAEPFKRGEKTITDINAQIATAKRDLERLNEEIDELNAASAPQNQLLNEILQYARVQRSTIGIDFRNRDVEIAATVARAEATALPVPKGGAR